MASLRADRRLQAAHASKLAMIDTLEDLALGEQTA